MASSSFQQLCSSSVPRAPCHGEKLDSNVGCRNPLTLRKNVEVFPQRIGGPIRTPNATASSSSSHATAECEFFHCQGVSGDGETKLGSRNPVTLRKKVKFRPQRFSGRRKAPSATASSSSSHAVVESCEFLHCHGGPGDGEAGLGSRNPITLRKKVEFFPQRFAGHVKSPDATAPSFSENQFLRCDGGRSDDGEAEFSRREVGLASMAFVLFALWGGGNGDGDGAAVAGVLDKYLKKKKLDPLDTYVPTVLLAQSQFQEVDGKLDASGEEKKFADARSLLRTGPAASLRTDIRAVAQYAAETGSNDDGPVASAAVDECLSALEDLDSLLFQASRSQGAPVERMKKDLTMTVAALDKLLATVPAPILEKSKAIAEAYKEASY